MKSRMIIEGYSTMLATIVLIVSQCFFESALKKFMTEKGLTSAPGLQIVRVCFLSVTVANLLSCPWSIYGYLIMQKTTLTELTGFWGPFAYFFSNTIFYLARDLTLLIPFFYVYHKDLKE